MCFGAGDDSLEGVLFLVSGWKFCSRELGNGFGDLRSNPLSFDSCLDVFVKTGDELVAFDGRFASLEYLDFRLKCFFSFLVCGSLVILCRSNSLSRQLIVI